MYFSSHLLSAPQRVFSKEQVWNISHVKRRLEPWPWGWSQCTVWFNVQRQIGLGSGYPSTVRSYIHIMGSRSAPEGGLVPCRVRSDALWIMVTLETTRNITFLQLTWQTAIKHFWDIIFKTKLCCMYILKHIVKFYDMKWSANQWQTLCQSFKITKSSKCVQIWFDN